MDIAAELRCRHEDDAGAHDRWDVPCYRFARNQTCADPTSGELINGIAADPRFKNTGLRLRAHHTFRKWPQGKDGGMT